MRRMQNFSQGIFLSIPLPKTELQDADKIDF